MTIPILLFPLQVPFARFLHPTSTPVCHQVQRVRKHCQISWSFTSLTFALNSLVLALQSPSLYPSSSLRALLLPHPEPSQCTTFMVTNLSWPLNLEQPSLGLSKIPLTLPLGAFPFSVAFEKTPSPATAPFPLGKSSDLVLGWKEKLRHPMITCSAPSSPSHECISVGICIARQFSTDRSSF